jgi:hypothetical protein
VGEFIAFGQRLGRAEIALPSLWPRVGAQVALQRCLILRTSVISLPYPLILPLQRGHLYFAKKGTFLLCIDMLKLSIVFMDINHNRVKSRISSPQSPATDFRGKLNSVLSTHVDPDNYS